MFGHNVTFLSLIIIFTVENQPFISAKRRGGVCSSAIHLASSPRAPVFLFVPLAVSGAELFSHDERSEYTN